MGIMGGHTDRTAATACCLSWSLCRLLPSIALASRPTRCPTDQLDPSTQRVEIRNMVGYLLEDGSNRGPRLFLAVLTILACLTGTGHVLRGWSQRDMPAEWGRIGVIV